MNEGLLGGLVGSALTAIALRILDLYQKRLEHRYGLKRSYFERKLISAEAAVSQGSLLSANLMGLSGLLDLIIKTPEPLVNTPPEFLKGMTDSFSQQLAKISSPSFDVGLAIGLFFDMGNNDDQETANRVLGLIWLISKLGVSFQFILSQLQVQKDPNQKAQLISTGGTILKELHDSILSLLELVKKEQSRLTGRIAHIRAEMKRYDS